MVLTVRLTNHMHIATRICLILVAPVALLGMVAPGAGFRGVTPFRSKNR